MQTGLLYIFPALLCMLAICNIRHTSHSYPLPITIRSRAINGSSEAALPTTTFPVAAQAAQTPTLAAAATTTATDVDVIGLAQQNGTDEVQDKGIFSWIGKLFKGLFHIGTSTANKALKKAMPILTSVERAKALLPAQLYVSKLTEVQKSEHIQVFQKVMSTQKRKFKALKNGVSNGVDLTSSGDSSQQDLVNGESPATTVSAAGAKLTRLS